MLIIVHLDRNILPFWTDLFQDGEFMERSKHHTQRSLANVAALIALLVSMLFGSLAAAQTP
jgi:hypothetical protein